jgi:stage II sporulation protein M
VGLPSILWAGRRWLLTSTALFIAGILIGWGASQADPDLLLEQLQPIVERIGGLGQQVLSADTPAERTWIIYRNNAQAVSVMMLAALVPLLGWLLSAFGMLGNGMLLGVVFGLGSRLSGRPVDPMQLFVGIAPHGVIELPAIWLGAAWSMRLGLRWLAPSAEGERWQVWQQCAKEAVIVLALVMVLLGIAAFVEGTVTLSLLRGASAAILLGSF